MTNEMIQVDPMKVAESIRRIGEEISTSKQAHNNLSDRPMWERVVSNNTRDLADGLARQADTLNALLEVIQGVIFLNINNAAYLNKVSKGIKFTEDGHSRHLSEYEKLSVDIIDAAIERSRISENGIAANAAEVRIINGQLDVLRSSVHQETKRLEEKSDEQYLKLCDEDKRNRDDIANIKKTTEGLTSTKVESDQRYQEFNHEAGKVRSDFFELLRSQHQRNQQLLISLAFLSIVEFGLIAYLFFR